MTKGCILLFLVFGALLLPGAAAAQVTLDTIPVIGSRASSDVALRTRSVRIIDAEEIRALPARHLAELLGATLGVEVGARSPAQSDLSIRGAGFEHVLVMVDGVRMSDPQTGHFDLNLTVPLDRIERIEILRGAASAMYGGDAVGGVVNIVTRREAGWGVRLEGGSFGTATAALHGAVPLGEGVTLELSAESGRSDGHRDDTDWDQRLGTLALQAPLAGGRLVVEGGRARRAFGAGDFYAPFPSFETTRVGTARVTWSGEGPRGLRLEPVLAWRSHDDDFILVREDPSIYRNLHTSAQLQGELVVRGRLPAEVAFAAGAEVARHRLRSATLGDHDEDRSALFAELVRTFPGGLEVTAGLRHDDHERWGGFTSPSLALSLPLAPELRLRASGGRAFRGATFTERYYEDPAHLADPELRPERSSSVEAGVHLGEGRAAALALTLFDRTSRDLIDWARPADDGDARWVTRNVNEARFRGIEVEGTLRVDAATRLRAGFSALGLEADVEEGVESKYALRPLRDQFQLVLDRELPRGLRARVVGARSRLGGGSGHGVVDLRLEAPFAGGRVHLDGRNLGGADAPDLTGNPIPGRAFYLGFSRPGR